MQRGFIVARALDFDVAVLLADADAGGNRDGLFALRSFDVERIGGDIDFHAFRQRNRFFSNSGHFSCSVTRRGRGLRRPRLLSSPTIRSSPRAASSEY